MQKENSIDWRHRHGDAKRGQWHPLYSAWSNMIGRCTNENHPGFSYYGARGIAVCPEWVDYIPFKEWATYNGWGKGLTLDRIDNSKGYSPTNCRWVDRFTQMSNTRLNKFLEYDGKRQTISQWSRDTGLEYKTIQGRIKYGWSVEKTLTTPVMTRRECGLAAHLHIGR